MAPIRPLPRAALFGPNVPVADAVAADWGEAVWTHPVDWRVAVLHATPVSLPDLVLGGALARLHTVLCSAAECAAEGCPRTDSGFPA